MWRKAFNILLAVVVILVFASTFYNENFPLGRLSIHFSGFAINDWPIFFQAATDFIKTGQLYSSDISLYGPGEAIYKFPPLYVSVLIELIQAGASEAILKYGTAIIQVVLFIACTSTLYFYIKKTGSFLFLCLALLFAMLFYPFVEVFNYLQLETYLLTLLCMAIVLTYKRWQVSAGICIGLAALLKIYPIFYVWYFLATRNGKALAGVVLGIFLGTLFTVYVVGFYENYHYWHDIAPVIFMEKTITSRANISVVAMALRLGFPYGIAQAAGVSILLLGMGVMWSMFNRQASKELIATSFSVLIAASLVGMKNSWLSYQLLLLIPIIVVMGLALSKTYFDKLALFFIVLASLLIFYGRPYHLQHWVTFKTSAELYQAIVFLRGSASLLILFLCIRLHTRVLRQEQLSVPGSE